VLVASNYFTAKILPLSNQEIQFFYSVVSVFLNLSPVSMNSAYYLDEKVESNKIRKADILQDMFKVCPLNEKRHGQTYVAPAVKMMRIF
jgi:hypothetical protein